MLTTKQRGGFGAALRERRQNHEPPYPTQAALADALHKLQSGVTWNRTKVADLERGKDSPDESELADLVALLGPFAPSEPEPQADLAALISALTKQAAAIERQAAAQEVANSLMLRALTGKPDEGQQVRAVLRSLQSERAGSSR